MKSILDVKEIKDLYLLIIEEGNIKYKDSILYISKKEIKKISEEKIYPFNTLINKEIKFYPHRKQSFIEKDIKILNFIEKAPYKNKLKGALELEEKDIGWININNDLNNIIGEIFLDRYIFNLYKKNSRKENIESNNFIFLEVEEDKKENKQIILISNIIINILERLIIKKVIVLKKGDIIYLLNNNTYIYLIPNIYICFCKEEHIKKLIN